MSRVYRFDRTAIKPPQKRADGSVRYDATLSRVGVFEYRLPDGQVRREYRPPEEVGRADSLESLELAPVVDGHPPKPGLARKVAVGAVGSVKFDGAHVTGSIVIYDDALNGRIARGDIRELSPGYSVVLDESPGVSPEGEAYDVIQRDIIYEHEAVVPRGRQGSTVTVHADEADGWRADAAIAVTGWGAVTVSVVSSTMSQDALERAVKDAVGKTPGLTIRTDKADGVTVEPGWADSRGRAHVQVSTREMSQDDLISKLTAGLASADAAVGPADMGGDITTDRADAANQKDPLAMTLEELQKKLATAIADTAAATARADAAEAKLATATARADKAEGERDAAIDRAAKADQARADAAAAAPAQVRARIRLEDTAAKVLGAEFKVDGVSDVEIQRAVIAKVTGKPLPEGKSPEYVAARYDAALEDAAAAAADGARLRETVTTPPPGQRTDAAWSEQAAKDALRERNRQKSANPTVA